MNRIRVSATAILMFACALPARPQAVLPERGISGGLKQNVFGLGLAAGAASGIGISFRQHFPGYFSYEINGGIIKVNKETSYDFGAELQYDFIRGAGVRFFSALAGGYYYSGGVNGNNVEAPARLGVGVGGEVPIQGGFHISGEILFTFFSDGTVLPLPQVAMHYYFY
ncbi:MAG TPA: hypothetical protein VK569_01760 [Bacteroidota bacterium]|nr:hypothetical protein [Bacteroidota bacterium]